MTQKWPCCVPMIVILSLLPACGGSGSSPIGPSSTSTSGGPGSAPGATPLPWRFAGDGLTLSNGGAPTAWSLNGRTLLYLSSGPTCCAPTALSSADGLSFSPTPTTNIGGNEFSFVTLPDGRYRMYYQSIPYLKSRVSRDGFNWTDEDGIRMDLTSPIGPLGAVPRVTEVPGGYRVYYVLRQNGPLSVSSAFSADGLTFTPDAGVRLAPMPGTIGWGDPAVVSTGSGYLMVVTQGGNPFSTLWLASSTDSLNWTLDSHASVSDPRGSPVDASWLPLGGGRLRLYYCIFLGRGSAGAAPFSSGQPNTDLIVSGVFTQSAGLTPSITTLAPAFGAPTFQPPRPGVAVVPARR